MQASIFVRMAPYLHLTFGQGAVCGQPALELGERLPQLGRGFLRFRRVPPRRRVGEPAHCARHALCSPSCAFARAARSAGDVLRREAERPTSTDRSASGAARPSPPSSRPCRRRQKLSRPGPAAARASGPLAPRHAPLLPRKGRQGCGFSHTKRFVVVLRSFSCALTDRMNWRVVAGPRRAWTWCVHASFVGYCRRVVHEDR